MNISEYASLPNNIHYAGAVGGLLEMEAKVKAREIVVDVELAKHIQSLQSNLAIAYEQRTANLIAMATARYADGSAMFPHLMGVDGDGLVTEIQQRTGQK